MGHANSIPQNRSLNRQVALSLWGTGTEYVNRLGVGGGVFERQLGEQGNTINPIHVNETTEKRNNERTIVMYERVRNLYAPVLRVPTPPSNTNPLPFRRTVPPDTHGVVLYSSTYKWTPVAIATNKLHVTELDLYSPLLR